MCRRPHIAIIVETSLVYGRRILQGITSYVQSHNPWSIFLDPREDQSPLPTWLESWQGDGVICRMTNARMAESMARAGVPVIDLNDFADYGLPRVWSNHFAIGVLGAKHLLERGFCQFGFCGFSGQDWALRRRNGFVSTVNAAGFPSSICESFWRRRHSRPWKQEQIKLATWLKSLPKPVGVMACNDTRGQQVLDACSEAGIAVPEETAVIGVDDDELLCNLCDPPLSSVIPNPARIGFDAAALLDELMNGNRLPRNEWLIEPLGIATRQSTDILAIDDQDVTAAIKMIRESACNGLTIEKMLDGVAVSRSSLERSFAKYLGHTLQAEIRRVQINRVKELLQHTDLPMAMIGHLAGYKHPEYMNVVFKRETGLTPGQFRNQSRFTE